MTTHDAATDRSRRAARAARLSFALTLPLALLLGSAGPGSAAVPQGWSDPEPVSAMDFLGVVVAAPLALALVIALLTYLPSMVRGQGLTPGSSGEKDQWFGGPTHGTAELAGPDDEGSEAGGAGARW